MLALAQDHTDEPQLKKGQKHRPGPRRYVTNEWRQRVVEALVATGKSKKDVGKACGVTGPYITQLLNGRYQTCRVILGINKELNIEFDAVVVDAPDMKELVSAAEDFDGEMMGALIDFAETLRKLKSKK